MIDKANRAKAPISERESEVLDCVSCGLSEKEIGSRLFISRKTVNNHLRAIRQKLGLTKNVEIMAYYVARANGIEFDAEKFRKEGIKAFLK